MEDQSDEISENDLMGDSYESPQKRASLLGALIVEETTNQKYTRADNALFLTLLVAGCCNELQNLLRRDPIARDVVGGDDKP